MIALEGTAEKARLNYMPGRTYSKQRNLGILGRAPRRRTSWRREFEPKGGNPVMRTPPPPNSPRGSHEGTRASCEGQFFVELQIETMGEIQEENQVSCKRRLKKERARCWQRHPTWRQLNKVLKERSKRKFYWSKKAIGPLQYAVPGERKGTPAGRIPAPR